MNKFHSLRRFSAVEFSVDVDRGPLPPPRLSSRRFVICLDDDYRQAWSSARRDRKYPHHSNERRKFIQITFFWMSNFSLFFRLRYLCGISIGCWSHQQRRREKFRFQYPPSSPPCGGSNSTEDYKMKIDKVNRSSDSLSFRLMAGILICKAWKLSR